jgi:hypothetical protein
VLNTNYLLAHLQFNFKKKILVLDLSGSFSTSETVTGIASDSSVVTATVVSFDSDRNILTLSDTTGIFANDTTITGNTSGATATVKILISHSDSNSSCYG